jgi:hypothetical protein
MNTILFFQDKIKYLGFELIDFSDFSELFLRFALNLMVILLIVRWLYYPTAKRKDYLFTYLLISTVIFLLCYLLENVKLELGFALGLFAIFGIIRYRTDSMPIKEMTYLFAVIGISVINALANKKVSVAEIVFTNLAIIGIAYGFEKLWLLKHESAKTIIYDRIDLINPDRYTELIDDVVKRTGIKNIKRVEVGQINFLKDTCKLMLYYEEISDRINMADQSDRFLRIDDDNDD